MAKITLNPPFPVPPNVVDLGEGVLVSSPLHVTYEDDAGLPFVVELDLVARAGRLTCESFTLHATEDGPPVTTEDLRRVPLAGIMRLALRTAAYARVPGTKTKYEPFEPDPDVAKGGPTDDALRAAATIYRMAYAINDNPTKAVASALDLTYPTAARWVARARDAGFLGPTTQGHAGEAAQED